MYLLVNYWDHLVTMNCLLNVLMGLKSFLKVSYLLVSQLMHDLLEVHVTFFDIFMHSLEIATL